MWSDAHVGADRTTASKILGAIAAAPGRRIDSGNYARLVIVILTIPATLSSGAAIFDSASLPRGVFCRRPQADLREVVAERSGGTVTLRPATTD